MASFTQPAVEVSPRNTKQPSDRGGSVSQLSQPAGLAGGATAQPAGRPAASSPVRTRPAGQGGAWLAGGEASFDVRRGRVGQIENRKDVNARHPLREKPARPRYKRLVGPRT